jgi:predicted ATP-grasp superfamily ATP-dependent carboligase
VVLPIAEPSILPILENRGRFEPAVIPFPDHGRFLRLSDKGELMRIAPRFGIAVPAQVRMERAADRLPHSIGYPVVVKPARSVAGAGDARVKLSVRHAANRAELDRVVRELPAAAFPLLLQERIIGPGVGMFLLRWEGRTLAAMAHRRIREKPPSGGVSVMRETIPAPADLVRRSEQLLDGFGWSGVAMVEYKLDGAGVPYLMEVNGRLWGSLQLAIDAGVDFPRLLVAAALGEKVDPIFSYRMVRSRWWWGEVDHLLARWRRRGGAGDEGLPSRLRTTVDILRPWHRRCDEEVFRWNDPKPFIRETRDWFSALGR